MGASTQVAEALSRLRALAEGRRPDDPLIGDYLAAYYVDLPIDDLDDRTLDDTYAFAAAHLDLGTRRRPGEVIVKVLSPDRDQTGWHSPHSTVLIVADDRPFLVDTIRLRLAASQVDVHLVVHPMLRVTRGDDGTITDVAAPGAGTGGALEAWTQLEIDRLEPAAARQLEADLRSAVDDVGSVVADFATMRQRLVELEDVHPALSWFAEENFVFLGAVDTRRAIGGGPEPDSSTGAGTWPVVPDSGLGQLRGCTDADLPAGVAAAVGLFTRQPTAIVIRSDDVADVFRAQRMTVLVVDDPHDPGLEHRFVGLLSSAAQRANALDIPGFGPEIAEHLGLVGAAIHTHAGRASRTVLENLPRDVVLELSAAQVARLVGEIVALQERRLVRVFEVPEPVGIWATVLVYFPRTRFTADLPERIADLVADAYGAEHRTFESFVGASTLARVTISVRRPVPSKAVDLEALTRVIDEQSTAWEDRLRVALASEYGETAGDHLFDRLGGSMTAAYRTAVAPARAAADLRRVGEVLDNESGFVVAMGHEVDARANEWRIRVYRRDEPMALSDLLPVLDNLGFVTLDEEPHTFRIGGGGRRADGHKVFLYDIGVAAPVDTQIDADVSTALRSAFVGVTEGTVENDGFNRLILRAGVTVEEAALLRAYAKYLRQINFASSQQYIEQALAAHPQITAALIAWFRMRFDPTLDRSDIGDAESAQYQRVLDLLDDVPSLDHDRICRMYLTLIGATVRTNYFRQRDTLAFKFDPQQIAELPLPRPAHEIWVCGPRVEGVHLRGGKIARGGLRWSDRREDFRTEVLGLMKAQMVKNAVIIPAGAKGGFVVKKPKSDLESNRQEVVECYQTFIRSLLDLTDNLVDGAVVAPPDTVVRDGDDTYLVVAADKGTATFSDVANAVAAEYDFWLGDAFASGGSVGYDHKAMGITARGAWESVRRHASVLGRNADTDALTAVGIGDMSGDVFGNGMLRSSALRLVAAFDHRHVFIDPDPDPAVSYAERLRLFELPRSSWDDYDRQLISAGGGVWPRSAKSIILSPEAQRVLGTTAAAFAPDQLISAILTAPVDLLWNGGIGTYVKASNESNADAGDRTNDGLRVDGGALRCRIVGEGGNLGFTQLGRIEYGLGGGLIFTDAIDNSAGVDCSDHEVNIKILLDGVVAAGELTLKQRNELLASMTDEVGELVLDNNKAQTLALEMARRNAPPMANVHARYIDQLETEGWLDRAIEYLPSDKQIAERQSAGQGLATPEMAVLIAYTKNANAAEVAVSDLPDAPLLADDLVDYFPHPLRQRYRDAIEGHPLRREIISTVVSNQMVNLSGISFDHRLSEDTGVSVVDVTRAWLVAREVFDFAGLWAEVDALGGNVKLEPQLQLFLDCRRMVERATLWVLRHRRPPYDPSALAARYRPGLTELATGLGGLLRGSMADVAHSIEAERIAALVPERLAERSAVWPLLHTGFDVVDIAERTERSVTAVAAVEWALFDELDLLWLWDAIGTLPRATRWQTQARSAVRDDLLSTLAALTEACVSASSGAADCDELVAGWIDTNQRAVARLSTMLAEIRRVERYDLTALSVALRQLRNLSRTSVG